jgi:hypothetical protein
MAVVYPRDRRNKVSSGHDNLLNYLDPTYTVRKHRLSRLLIPHLCRMFQNDMQRSIIGSHTYLQCIFPIYCCLLLFATVNILELVVPIRISLIESC